MNEKIDILLIEDDPNDVDLTLRAFESHHLTNTIHVIRDGAEAIEFVRRLASDTSPTHPKLVLLDLKLPKVDGLEILRTLKTTPATRSLPVVILTSSREAPDLKAAYELGVNSYLCKPVEFQDFVNVVKQIGLYWLLLNEPPTQL